jgi:two-component system chemotaxis response regulator CheY
MTIAAAAKGVMVVDDEVFFRGVLGDMLAADGFSVVAEAADGDEAVGKYLETRPALVLMDIYMPETNGIEATRRIIAADPTAKVIICSGTGYDDDIAAAMQAGALGVIYKPFYGEEVMATINRLLGG